MSDAAKVAKGVTDRQAYWVRNVAATEYGLYSRLAVPYLDGGGINGAVKKGLLEWTGGGSGDAFLRLTDLGRAVLPHLPDPPGEQP